jgi:cob(I)alamin adenosyltransferase
MENKGLIIVHTGDGKGKTTAALGMALRAWGNHMRVLILQFIKGSWSYGELEAIKALSSAEGCIDIRQGGLGFSQRGDGAQEEHRRAAVELLQMAVDELQSDAWDMVILDEFNYAYSFGFIQADELEALLSVRPAHTHLIFTGRNASEELIERADLVTEMRLIKHPFQKGIKAQKGIEF